MKDLDWFLLLSLLSCDLDDHGRVPGDGHYGLLEWPSDDGPFDVSECAHGICSKRDCFHRLSSPSPERYDNYVVIIIDYRL